MSPSSSSDIFIKGREFPRTDGPLAGFGPSILWNHYISHHQSANFVYWRII